MPPTSRWRAPSRSRDARGRPRRASARADARYDHDRCRRHRAPSARGCAAQGVPGDRRRRRDEARGRPRRPSRQRDQARAPRSGRISAPPTPTRWRRGLGRRATSARWARRCRSCSTPASPTAPTSSAPTSPTRTCAESSPAATSRIERVDVRTVVAGDTINGSVIRIEPAIEVGNIFKLGTRYSLPLGARYLDESGQEQLIHMGCYGFGPGAGGGRRRRAVRRRAGDLLAPHDRAVRRRAGHARQGRGATSVSSLTGSTTELREVGLDTLYDERDAGPGEKFTDAELLGCPLTGDGRAADAVLRRGRGADPAGPGVAHRAGGRRRRGGRRAVARPAVSRRPAAR